MGVTKGPSVTMRTCRRLLVVSIVIVLQLLPHVGSAHAFGVHTDRPATCNCISLSECVPYRTLLQQHQHDANERKVLLQLLELASCGFDGHEALACCPVTIGPLFSAERLALEARAARLGKVATTEEPWIWERRPHATTTDQVLGRLAKYMESRYYDELVLNHKDPKTLRNCPHSFYEEGEDALFERHSDFREPKISVANHHHNHYHQFGPHSHEEEVHQDLSGELELDAPFVYPDAKRRHRPIVFPKTPERTASASNAIITVLQPVGPSTGGGGGRGAGGSEAAEGNDAPATDAATTAEPSATSPMAINSPTCGVSVGTRIVGGTSGAIGQFPWIARIAYVNRTSNRISYRCSGSLITDLYVVTAAHCVVNLVSDLQLSHVRIGDAVISDECQVGDCLARNTFSVSDVVVHSSYDQPKYANDIALLKIVRPAAGSRPASDMNYSTICLPLNNSAILRDGLAGSTGLVAGWGGGNNEGMGSAVNASIRYLRLPIVNTTECAITYAKFSEVFRDPIVITPSQMCAQGLPMNDVCRGDSGGPFMDDGSLGLVGSTTGRYTLLGLVSFGPMTCGLSNIPGVYTRLSSFVDWIVANLRY